MRSIKDGGSAFPCEQFCDPGMSLRDWFAGMAMQGLAPVYCRSAESLIKELPKYAYELADAKLAEREKS